MAYSKAVVAIPNVSGNIVINVTTSAAGGNLFDAATSIYNSRTDSGGTPKPAGERPGALVTNKIPIDSSMQTLKIEGITEVFNSALGYYMKVVGYDSSDASILQVAYDQPAYTYDVAAALASRPALASIRFVFVLKDGVSISETDTTDLLIYSS